MEMTPKTQSTSWWISSLAISVVCCAILFVVFAGYLVDLDKTMAIMNVRIDMLEQRQNRTDNDMEGLRRRTAVQQIQVVPSSQPVQLPVSVMPAQEATPVAPAKK